MCLVIMSKRKDVEWKDVEREFRLIFYNIGKSINKLFESKEKKIANRKLAIHSSKPNERKK